VLEFPQPHHLPCPACGASVARGKGEEHACDEERRLDFLVVQLRDEIAGFDGELATWLETPTGRFAAWIAERER
jgi:hypothetical protein